MYEINSKSNRISKSYKIMPFYSVLFSSCIQLFRSNELVEALINQHFDFEEFPLIPKYEKNDFFINLIEDFKKENYSLQEVKELFVQERMLELNKLGEVLHNYEIKEVLNLRIPPQTKIDIENLSSFTKLAGEVIEASIAHFINRCDKEQYDIIKFIFEGEILYYSTYK